MGLMRISMFVGLVSLFNFSFRSTNDTPTIHKHVIQVTDVSVENPIPHPAPIYDDEEDVARSQSSHHVIN